MHLFTVFLLLVTASLCYPLYGHYRWDIATRPQRRRIDYPLDQDCQLCHAIVIEAVKRIGGIVSVSNTRNVVNSICKTSSFEG